MDSKALRKARLRYNVALSNAQALQTTTSFEDFSQHWYVFLHAAKGIYTTLEQGAKATPQARQWFGRKNQERKDDPLLRYISEARNDDEHGIEDAVERAPSKLEFGVSDPDFSAFMRDQRGNTFAGSGAAVTFVGKMPTADEMPDLTPLDGKPVKIVFTPERPVLKAVHDRMRRSYDPPTDHLGKQLKSGSPQEVARLTVDYLADLLQEAEGFCKP